MNLSEELGKHIRGFYLGPNATGVNLKETLDGITWEQANVSIKDLNTIGKLVFHIGYYVAGVIQVINGGPLDIRDKYSYDMEPIASESDWLQLKDRIFSEGEAFAKLVEEMPEQRLYADFDTGKYGNYYKNLTGIIEHSHYHLGQIALIKRMLNYND